MHRFRFWNVRGMNKPSKQLDIKHFITSNKVDLFGILETKVQGLGWNKIKNNICAIWMVCTNSSNSNGGRIWIIWNL